MIDRRKFISGGAGLAGASALGPVGALAAPQDSDLVIRELTVFHLRDAVFVKLTTDSGVEGWGECDRSVPSTVKELVIAEGSRFVLGADPFQTTKTLYDFFFEEHDALGGILAGAIAGLDIAMWDLKAKILDVPIWRLLGGKFRDEIPLYGSFATDRWRKLSPREAADMAVKFARRGMKTVKCRMQVRESALDPVPDRTVEYVEAITRRLPQGVDLFVDINNGYTAKRAIRIGLELYERFGMKYFEDPCSDQNHSHTKEVVDALPMHIISGEKEYTPYQFQELITYADPDYINPDVIKAMGITSLQKIGTLSQVNQKPITLHNTRPIVSTAASLHLAASFPILGPFMEYPDEDKFTRLLRVLKNGLDYNEGVMRVPDGPGLGVEIDEEEVRAQALSVETRVLET